MADTDLNGALRRHTAPPPAVRRGSAPPRPVQTAPPRASIARPGAPQAQAAMRGEAEALEPPRAMKCSKNVRAGISSALTAKMDAPATGRCRAAPRPCTRRQSLSEGPPCTAERPTSSWMAASIRAPRVTNISKICRHPPPKLRSLPPIRNTTAGSGRLTSNGASTTRNVSSSTPPHSTAKAPVLTRKPSTSTDEKRPPTRSRSSTTSGRSPAAARRAAAARPPMPAPITTQSNVPTYDHRS